MYRLTHCSRTIAAILIVLFVMLTTLGKGLADDVGNALMAGRWDDVIKIIEGKFPDMSKATTRDLAYLCPAYGEVKSYTKHLACLDQAERNIEKGDTQLGQGFAWSADDVKSMRARVLAELGDYQAAIAQLRAARTSTPAILVSLGIVSALNGDRATAERVLNALKPRLPAPTDNSPAAAGTRQEMFTPIYIALGDYRSALNLIEKVDDFDEKNFGPLESDRFVGLRIRVKFMLSKCLLETGQIQRAKNGYEQLLKLPQIAESGFYWLILFDRGRIAASEGDIAGAIEFWKRAVEVIERQRSTINTEAMKIGFVGDKQAVYRKLIAALFLQQRLSEAFDFVERSKSRALVDMLAHKQDFAVAAADPQKVRELLAQSSRTELAAVATTAGTAQGARRNLAIQRTAITQQAPELASLVSVSSTPIVEIQAGIPEDEALVEYYYDDTSLFVFVLSRSGLKGVRLDATSIEEDVRTLRRHLEHPEASDNYLSSAQKLYARLIRPIEGIIGKSKLVVVPHGALHYLPFAVLHDGNGFLLEKYSVRFLPSASVIKHIRAARTPKPGGVLAFGNPDLGDPKRDLRFAQQEAEAIARVMPQSRALVRKEATETALREYGNGFAYVHFATHGQFDAEKPLQSALFLAKDTGSDGLLTVDKLYSMRLEVDFVALSACETGLGKVASGDDVVGLTRGFLYAGTSAIVASLWKVDDRATAELMSRFYEGLKHRDRREALRQAQLATKGKFQHPFFWAAFQLTGNAQ